MEKTKLGVSVGLLGAVMFLTCLYGGFIPSFLLAGYILLAEKDTWLKKLSVKAVVLMIAFSVASTVVYLIPNVISCIGSIASAFGGHFYISFISSLASAIDSILGLAEKLVFIALAALSLMHVTVPVPVVDTFVEKHIEIKEN